MRRAKEYYCNIRGIAVYQRNCQACSYWNDYSDYNVCKKENLSPFGINQNIEIHNQVKLPVTLDNKYTITMLKKSCMRLIMVEHGWKKNYNKIKLVDDLKGIISTANSDNLEPIFSACFYILILAAINGIDISDYLVKKKNLGVVNGYKTF